MLAPEGPPLDFALYARRIEGADTGRFFVLRSVYKLPSTQNVTVVGAQLPPSSLSLTTELTAYSPGLVTVRVGFSAVDEGTKVAVAP
jgi:hypothetical protein